MAKLHGRNGLVLLQGTGAAPATLTQAADWEIDTDKDLVSIPSLGDIWDSKVQGLMKFTIKCSGQYDTASNLAWDTSVGNSAPGAPRGFYIYPDNANPTRYYYGNCWPKLNVKGGVTAAVLFDLSAEGDGALSKN